MHSFAVHNWIKNHLLRTKSRVFGWSLAGKNYQKGGGKRCRVPSGSKQAKVEAEEGQ
jgi:hypothetical protein